jgi:hypothetical protein
VEKCFWISKKGEERRGEEKIKKWCPVLQAAKPFVFGAER